MSYEILTLKERPALMSQVDSLSLDAWPRFMLYANTSRWRLLFSRFAAFQVLACGPNDRLAAIGNSLPFQWDGTLADLPESIPDVMDRGIRQAKERSAVNTLAALAAIVDPGSQGQGLSSTVLRAMIELARKFQLTSLLAPVRPTLKSRYPLVPLLDYVEWKREDGAPFDPWLRTHWRLGGTVLDVIPSALTVQGSVGDWEEWTGLRFPQTGKYVVEGALQPVYIDCENDRGRYDDPNVWVRHVVEAP